MTNNIAKLATAPASTVSKTKWGWIAPIYVNGKRHHLGYFKTPEQAQEQHRKAERFAELNPEQFPHLTSAMLRNFITAEESAKDFLENDDN